MFVSVSVSLPSLTRLPGGPEDGVPLSVLFFHYLFTHFHLTLSVCPSLSLRFGGPWTKSLNSSRGTLRVDTKVVDSSPTKKISSEQRELEDTCPKTRDVDFINN